MKRILILLAIVTVLITASLMLAPVAPALAQSPTPPVVTTPAPAPPVTEPVAVDFLVKILFGLSITVPGFTAAGVTLVNLLKIPGWVADGNAQVIQNVLSVVFAIVIGCLTLFLPNVNVGALDVKFGDFAKMLTVLLPTFAILYSWLAPLLHNAIRGFPLIGYSHSVKPQLSIITK